MERIQKRQCQFRAETLAGEEGLVEGWGGGGAADGVLQNISGAGTYWYVRLRTLLKGFKFLKFQVVLYLAPGTHFAKDERKQYG